MAKKARTTDPQSAFCEVCLKRVSRSEALTAEGKDFVAYFCGNACYERWRGERAPAPPPHEMHEGAAHGIARDERMKRAIRQHPQRDEPRVDSVEPDELPPR
jgi:hypothetical protein